MVNNYTQAHKPVGQDGQQQKPKSVYKYVPGDWICPTCEDLQFRRNQCCRICGTMNPMVLAQELAVAAGKSLPFGGASVSKQSTAASDGSDLVPKGKGKGNAMAMDYQMAKGMYPMQAGFDYPVFLGPQMYAQGADPYAYGFPSNFGQWASFGYPSMGVYPMTYGEVVGPEWSQGEDPTSAFGY